MSAIGDYIHATSLGYCRHGEPRGPYYETGKIQQMIQNRESDLNSWIAQRVVNASIRKQMKDEMEKDLSLLKGLQDNSDTSLTTEENKHAEMLFQEMVDNISLDLSKIDIEALKRSNSVQGAIGYKEAQQTYYNSEEWENKVLTLITKLTDDIQNTLIEIAKNDQLTIDKIKNKMSHLQGQEENLLSLMQSANFTQGKNRRLTAAANSYFKEIKSYMSRNKTLKGKSYKKVNKLIKDFVDATKKKNLASNYSGQVGEALTKIVAPRIEKLAADKTNTEIIGRVVGTKSSQRIVGNLSTDFVDLQNLVGDKKYTIINDEGLIVTANAASEKIDVELWAKGNKKNGVFASVKNYNTESLKSIPFQSQNTLSLLFNENKDNLINHFLNLQTINYTGAENGIWEGNKKIVNQYIRKLLLKKLISGDGTGIRNGLTGSIKLMKSANVFVTINSDNYEVNIYSIGDLLNQVYKHKSKYINYEGLLPELQVLKDPLSTYSSAKERITNILRPLMQPSYVAIDINDIKNNYN